MLNKNQYTNKILCGHALEILRKLPPKIAQCCITSPPYWGLRVYSGEQERIWHGKPDCKHSFKQTTQKEEGYNNTRRRWQHGATRKDEPQNWTKQIKKYTFCKKCGAWKGQLGLEPLHDCMAWARGEKPCPVCYVCHLRVIFAEVKRTLRDDGILWLNLGDSYAGSGKAGTSIKYQRKHAQFRQKERKERLGLSIKPPKGLKPKDLVGIPWRCALALQADGWYLRSDVIYAKTNPTPESVKDRPTKAHEYLFLLAKSRQYYYDADAIREPLKEHSIKRYKYKHSFQRSFMVPNPKPRHPKKLHPNPLGRNKRSVWIISVVGFPGAHFATFPRKLVAPCILAGSSPKQGRNMVLDPFIGSGTTAIVALNNNRTYLGIDISKQYTTMAQTRIKQETQQSSLL